MGTIQKYLEEWRAGEVKNTPSEDVPVMPEEFLRAWTRMAQDAWLLVGSKAAKEITKTREHAEQEIARAREEADAATKLTMSIEEDLHTASTTIDQLDQEIRDARAKLALSEGALNELRAANQEDKRRIARLEEEMATLRDALLEERGTSATAQERVRLSEIRIGELSRDLHMAQESVAAGAEENGKLQTKILSFAEERIRYEHTIERLSDELQEVRAEWQKAEEENDALTAKIAELSKVVAVEKVAPQQGSGKSPHGERLSVKD